MKREGENSFPPFYPFDNIPTVWIKLSAWQSSSRKSNLKLIEKLKEKCPWAQIPSNFDRMYIVFFCAYVLPFKYWHNYTSTWTHRLIQLSIYIKLLEERLYTHRHAFFRCFVSRRKSFKHSCRQQQYPMHAH